MYGYVYLTTNLVNNRKYIGQHKSSKFDKRYLGSGLILAQAIEMYGKKNFICEILEECNSQEELDEAEKRIIKERNAVYSDEYYNIAFGGNTRHGPLSDEQKHLLSECAKKKVGEKNPFYGKKHSEVTRQKISTALNEYYKNNKNINIGKIAITNGVINKRISADAEIPEGFYRGATTKPFTQEHIDNIRKAVKNRVYTEETRLRMSLAQKEAVKKYGVPFKGKHHTEEAKKRMSELSKKENLSAETRQKMSEARTKHNIGKIWINDGVNNKFVSKSEVEYYVEQGYSVGRLVKFQEGKLWITNGITNTRINNGDSIPEGWRRGFTKRGKSK